MAPGVDPTAIVGKALRSVSLSNSHPALTFHFDDNSSFQVLVDGYDPLNPGLPKSLEMDPLFHNLLADPVPLTVTHCTAVSLQDKAFHSETDQHWDKSHLALAFKFSGAKSEIRPRWHCIWATLQEFDESKGSCVFRSYHDVYLEKLGSRKRNQSPTKRRRTPSPTKRHRSTNSVSSSVPTPTTPTKAPWAM